MCEVSDDWQSETGSRNLVIQAFTDLEYPVQRFGRQPWPVVFDRDHDLGLALLEQTANYDRPDCPLACVVYQICEHLVEVHRVT